MAKKKNENYEEWHVDDLHAEAGRRDIQGRSAMSKAELVEALSGPDAGKGEASSGAGVGARRADEAPPEKGDDVLQEQPSAEPKDLTTGQAGDWSTPPPGQVALTDRPVRGVPPETADPNKVPRVINPGLRAEEGFSRFKIRADVPGENTRTLYVLAKEGDQKGAEDCYLKACGLDRKRRVLDERTGDVREVVRPVDLVTKELRD
jgi:hypothetical protein